MNYRTELIECLGMVGIIVSPDENTDVDLTRYQIDSLTFISLMIEIENHFDIIIPDEYLTYETLKSLNGLSNMISVICQNNT